MCHHKMLLQMVKKLKELGKLLKTLLLMILFIDPVNNSLYENLISFNDMALFNHQSLISVDNFLWSDLQLS